MWTMWTRGGGSAIGRVSVGWRHEILLFSPSPPSTLPLPTLISPVDALSHFAASHRRSSCGLCMREHTATLRAVRLCCGATKAVNPPFPPACFARVPAQRVIAIGHCRNALTLFAPNGDTPCGTPLPKASITRSRGRSFCGGVKSCTPAWRGMASGPCRLCGAMSLYLCQVLDPVSTSQNTLQVHAPQVMSWRLYVFLPSSARPGPDFGCPSEMPIPQRYLSSQAANMLYRRLCVIKGKRPS